MVAVFMYLFSSVIFATTLFVCCGFHSHPQYIYFLFFLLIQNFVMASQGWKISKRAKEGSNPERLVSLGCEVVECAGRHTDIVRICAVNRDCKVRSRIVI
jgi:hypothetical protein